MEGKELLKLLDLVTEVRKKGDDFEKGAKEADEPFSKGKLKAKAEVYKEVSERLETVLRDINS